MARRTQDSRPTVRRARILVVAAHRRAASCAWLALREAVLRRHESWMPAACVLAALSHFIVRDRRALLASRAHRRDRCSSLGASRSAQAIAASGRRPACGAAQRLRARRARRRGSAARGTRRVRAGHVAVLLGRRLSALRRGEAAGRRSRQGAAASSGRGDRGPQGSRGTPSLHRDDDAPRRDGGRRADLRGRKRVRRRLHEGRNGRASARHRGGRAPPAQRRRGSGVERRAADAEIRRRPVARRRRSELRLASRR